MMNSSYGRARGDISGAMYCGRVDLPDGECAWTGWHRDMEDMDREVARRFPGARKVAPGWYRIEG